MTMGILPEPKDSDDKLLEFLKGIMGEDGLVFLDLDNAIAAVKQAHPPWQAPFAIGLRALPFLYHWETGSQRPEVPSLAVVVLGLAFHPRVRSTDNTLSELIGSALEPLETQYATLSTKVKNSNLQDEDAHTLFHTRFALGVLTLLKGDEEQGTRILREMAATKMAQRGVTFSSEGLTHFDVKETKALAAIILQDFYVRRRDYEMALRLLTEGVAVAYELFSESLLAVVPGLLDSFAEKCEREDDFGEWFEGWVGLLDRTADITELCGEADASGDLPSKCKTNSPQFWAWKFGQLSARFVVRYNVDWDDSEQLLPTGYSGEDWGNGTVVASLLCEYEEHRNWHRLRQGYVSMWESSSRYQWLSLCEAGTWTDLYWAVRIGFADKMLEFANLESLIPTQTEPAPVIRDIEMTKDIASTIAIRQIKEQLDLDKLVKNSELLQNILEERLPPGKRGIHQQLQQRLSPVWSILPAKVVNDLVKAEKYYKTGVDTDDAKVWFNKAVEASLNCCFVEPLVGFTQKQADRRIAVCFPSPRGVERKTSHELRKLFLWEWSVVFDTLSVPADKTLAGLGAEDLKRFMKEHFGELPPSALRELSRSLGDFCQQKKDGSHSHVSRHEDETQELEQMRELALGIERSSVITQIFQLFGLR
jgi:hypothetical protein